ncbi:MAG: hypothetical protein OJF51_000993 [Nitrospira sp.]|nr:MAG: hypothetical protein OJF51_000993 [Nitrospira sp.]
MLSIRRSEKRVWKPVDRIRSEWETWAWTRVNRSQPVLTWLVDQRSQYGK